MMKLLVAFVAQLVLFVVVQGLLQKPNTVVPSTMRNFGVMGGQRWGNFAGFECKVIGTATEFGHMGDANPAGNDDYESMKRKRDYNLNVGKALETLRRELPMIFAASNLDFSIFANQITVADGNGNKMMMQKSLYSAAVKSLRMASALSSIYPSMNVKKIEYIENVKTIQCLVDVVLPDTVRVDGQAVWEGMFYFGLDEEGLIMTHIFDRKITKMSPQQPLVATSFPWLRAAPSWNPELLRPIPRPQPGLVAAILEEKPQSPVLEILSP